MDSPNNPPIEIPLLNNNKIIELNVGGTIYATSLDTLTKYPDSMLGVMFTRHLEMAVTDRKGRYFIDRDGQVFGVILNYLRTESLVVPKDMSLRSVVQEASFYGIDLVAGQDEIFGLPDIDVGEHVNLHHMLTQTAHNRWSEYAHQSIRENMGKVVKSLLDIIERESDPDLKVTLQLYRKANRNNSVSVNRLRAFPARYTISVYLSETSQVITEIWVNYLRNQGFADAEYDKQTYPAFCWVIYIYLCSQELCPKTLIQ
eukprot:TRINITY_DN5495_c0_g1_i1.p1 TRINITY_DN5495_c0_g1~~TRINITY_DN5495_c0_g1_i1.p1  ORF type:complete len:258 (+),score=34.00 TRINITY_DN5495_c0_g1_i1:27-800(+)